MFEVQTRAHGLPWTAATKPNQNPPQYRTKAEAEAAIASMRTDRTATGYDDPMWAEAEYRIIRRRGATCRES